MARLLGIDIGETVIRVALLRTSYRKMALEAVREIPISEEMPLKKAMVVATESLKPDAVCVAMPGDRVFYRRIDLPVAAQKELASVLGFELEATVPFEMDDAVFDYRPLKKSSGVDTMTIFAAIAKTDEVRERIQQVREATGLEPERVSPGALSLAQLELIFPTLNSKQGPIAILDIGEKITEVVIVNNNEPVFSRTVLRGAQGLPESAEKMARELRQTFAAWLSIGGAPLFGMVLTGIGARAEGAEYFLSTELGVQVLSLSVPTLENWQPEFEVTFAEYARAISLALGLTSRARTFNLRQGALEAERSYPFLTEKLPVLSGLAAVIALSFGFNILAQVRALDSERAVLEQQLANATKEVFGQEATTPEKARELLEQNPSTADEDPLPKVDGFDVMVQLSKAVPKDVVHDVAEFDVSRGHVSIHGIVPNVSDAQTIQEKMKEHRCFKDVKIVRTSQYADGKQKYVMEFDLKCEDKKKKKSDSDAPEATSAAPSSGDEKPEANE